MNHVISRLDKDVNFHTPTVLKRQEILNKKIMTRKQNKKIIIKYSDSQDVDSGNECNYI